MHSLYPELARQRIALLLEEAEADRLASQARAARRRRRQHTACAEPSGGRATAALGDDDGPFGWQRAQALTGLEPAHANG